MKQKRLKISIVLLFVLGLAGLQAQVAFNTSGGNASGNNGSMSYSVGQVTYSSQVGVNGSIMQGVQQPFEITVISGINDALDINLSVSVYPNPTTSYLTLDVKELELSELNFQLYDMNGKLLQDNKIISNQTSIKMDKLVSATYFLKVLQKNKEVKTFKVIKK